MIEMIMLIGIGFLVAALALLTFVPLVHNRAVRLTTRKIENSLPISKKEIAATRDLMRAEFAMATRRMEVTIDELKDKNTLQLVALSKKEDAANHLTVENRVLRYRVRVAEEDIAAKIMAINEIEHALSVNGPELARLTSELHEKSARTNTQTVEIIALRTQVEILKERLNGTSKELETAEIRRNKEHSDLEATTEKLIGERGKFEIFYSRVADIKQRLAAQTAEDKLQFRQVQEDFESRLNMQTRLLKERERELQILRRELDLARKAEADLRIEIIAGDNRANTAVQAFQAEKDKIQAMLERAQAECARLNYEIKSRNRKTKDTQAA
jgi:chromosome segregation ATPase